jgi:hypothetical protein
MGMPSGNALQVGAPGVLYLQRGQMDAGVASSSSAANLELFE